MATFPNQAIDSLEQQGQSIRSFLNHMERVISWRYYINLQIIAEHPLWKDASEEEMDLVSEGIEKFVTTKLFDQYVALHFHISLTCLVHLCVDLT